MINVNGHASVDTGLSVRSMLHAPQDRFEPKDEPNNSAQRAKRKNLHNTPRGDQQGAEAFDRCPLRPANAMASRARERGERTHDTRPPFHRTPACSGLGPCALQQRRAGPAGSMRSQLRKEYARHKNQEINRPKYVGVSHPHMEETTKQPDTPSATFTRPLSLALPSPLLSKISPPQHSSGAQSARGLNPNTRLNRTPKNILHWLRETPPTNHHLSKQTHDKTVTNETRPGGG